MPPARLVLLALLLAAPARAEIAEVDTPQGLARVVGDPFGAGERLVVGGRTALESEGLLWIEAVAGTLLLVGMGSGGTACPAQWAWVHAGEPGLRVTAPFGTCSDLATVSADAETVTVTMPSHDPDFPGVAFVYDGKGPVRERPQLQAPSGAPPEDGALAWVGRYPYDLVRSSDWRGPLVALMGEDGYDLAQTAIGTATPMERHGDWVEGSGFDPATGGDVGGAIAINATDGRLLVALYVVDGGVDGGPRLWGDPGGPLPPAIAAALAP